MGRKRKAPAPGPQQGQEAQKSKREKHIACSAGAMDEKEMTKDETVMDKERCSVCSGEKLGATGGKDIDTSSRINGTGDVVMTEESKGDIAPFNGSPSGKGDFDLVTGENNTVVGVVQKKAKRKKGRKACGGDPSSKRPTESSPSNHQVNSELVSETAEMDSKSENLKEASISNDLISPVGKEDVVSRSADDDPDEKLDMVAGINSHSFEVKSTSSIQTASSKQQMESKPIDISVKEDASSNSADNSSVLNIVDMNSVRKNNSEGSININTSSLVYKEDASLTKCADIGSMKSNIGCAFASSLHDVKNASSKRNKRDIREGKSNSSCSSESFQGNGKRLSSPVTQNCTSVNSSLLLKMTDVGSVNRNGDGIPISDNLVLLSKEEGLLENIHTDINKKNVSPDIDLKSDEVISTSLKKRKKSRKKKTMNSGTNSVACPSLNVASDNGSSISGSVEMGSVRMINNETSLSDNLASSVENEDSRLTGGDSNKTDILPDMNVNSDIVKNSNLHVHKKKQHKGKVLDYSQYNSGLDPNDSVTCPSLNVTSADNVDSDIVKSSSSQVCKKLQHKGKKKFCDCSQYNLELRNDPTTCPSLNVTYNNSSSLTENVEMGSARKISNAISPIDNQVPLVEKESSCLKGGDSGKTEMLPEMSVDSDIVKSSSSHLCKKTQHRRKKKVFDYSQYNVELDRDDSSVISSPLSVELVGNNIANASVRSALLLNSGMEDSVPAPKESDNSPEMASSSFQVEDPGSIIMKMAKKETDKSSTCSVCPSPIRGLVDDLASTDVPKKQNNQLDMFNEEEGSFSFQVADKVLMDTSSVSYSERACQSGSGVGSGNVSTALHADNALDSMSTCTHKETVDAQGEKEMASSSISRIAGLTISSDVSKSEDKKLKEEAVLLERTLITCTRKKLLILDLNGLLADIFLDFRNVPKAHIKVGGKAVFKRPFCDDFLKFCFEKFDIGVWSSRRKYNVEVVVDYLMGDAKHKLLFCWDQSKCTLTGFKTVDNAHKPLVLKELKKLWNKEEPGLPWEKGEYSPSNTLLVDDSPYKALCNPPHTGVFPCPYHFNDENDNALGPGGDIRVYLEGVAMADDVQQYVQENPFGQDSITATNPSWKFYLQIIDKIENTSASV